MITCPTEADVQVRSAYRKKGWAFTDPQGIEQCAQEGFSKALQEQAGEGCHMWGAISINKVGSFMICLLLHPALVDRHPSCVSSSYGHLVSHV